MTPVTVVWRYLQGRFVTTSGVEIEPERFRELKLRDAIIIQRQDQLGLLIRKRYLGLKDIEARHRARLESILLILQLALKEFD